MDNSTVGLRPHQAEIEKIDLINIDGTTKTNMLNLVTFMTLDMGIYTKVLYGTMYIMDSVGLYSSTPIIGEETIEIVLAARGYEKKKLRFNVVRIYDFEYSDDYKATAYKLDFISKEGMTNIIKDGELKHFVSTTDKFTPADLVRSIVSNFLDSSKQVATGNESYADSVQVLFPKVSPFKAIDMICSRTFNGDTTKSSNFMFYEDLDQFNFKSINTMINTTPVEYYFNSMQQGDIGTMNSNIGMKREYEFFSIVNFRMPNKSNNIDRIRNGMIDSELLRFNPIDKGLHTNKQTYDQFINNFPSLELPEKRAPFTTMNSFEFFYRYASSNPEEFASYHNVNYGVQESLTSFNSKAASFAKSSAMAEAMKQIQYDIVVPGNTKIMPGQTIEINTFPRGVDYNDGDKFEKYMSGKSIVVGVRHVYNQKDFTTILTCAKPSLAQAIESIHITNEPLPQSF